MNSSPRFLAGIGLACGFCFPPLHAVVDLDGNGQSDVFEIFYQVDGDPDGDPDGDGQPNWKEAVAGTDPHDARDLLAIVDGTAPSQGSVSLTFEGKEGKIYSFQFCRQMGSGSWEPIGSSVEGTGGLMTVELPLQLPVYQTGAIRYERFENIGSGGIAGLLADPDYPDNPDASADLTSFASPHNIADGYGARVHGFVVPSESGTHTFYISTDDNGELRLGSGTDPATAGLVASVPGWAPRGDWTKYPEQQSEPVLLAAGQAYYIEALVRENVGGDHVQVAWQTPSDSTIRIIPGGNLAVPESGSGEDLGALKQLFFRIIVTDQDSDKDGVSDAEERLLGWNPAVGDSDGDGTDDLATLTNLLSATDTVSIEATLGTVPEVALGGRAEFTLHRSGGLRAVEVLLDAGGTATGGLDYEVLPATVTVPFGQNSVTVPVWPLGDGETEPDESVVAEVLPGAAYSLGADTSAEVTITESAPPTTPFLSELRPLDADLSSAFGTATLALSFTEDAATLSLQYAGLSSPQTTAHLCIAPAGQDGTVVEALPLYQLSNYEWTFSPTGDITVADIAQALHDGELCVSVGSEAFPGGELRGQFVPADGSHVPPVPAPPPPLPPGVPTEAEAARLLTQATFGPTMAGIQEVRTLGIEGWIDAQLALPFSSHMQAYDDNNGNYQNERQEAWWKHSVEGPDQLRQRMAFALSEIFVISDQSSELKNSPRSMANYYDLLGEHAFGNYRDLLEAVTLNPLMGKYLDMIKNEKPNPETGAEPDENYAREVLQLFSIGLWKLHQDGSRQFDQYGLPVPTYDQDVIVGFAHVFTGWSYYNPDGSKGWRWGSPDNYNPMSPYEDYHDTDAKVLLDGYTIPAGQSAREDLEEALDLIFHHPNVGPFIAEQLIQRLVTSNPGRGYIHRVAGVFNDNGQGVRGDLAAVVKAILMDPEARLAEYHDNDGYGKWREPLLRVTHLFRAFGAHPVNPDTPDDIWRYWNPEGDLGQAALRSPSVFNFFEPGYIAPGIIADLGLRSPEAQIASETNVIKTINLLWSITNRKGLHNNSKAYRVRWEWPAELTGMLGATPAENDVEGILDYLDLLFLNGQMSAEMRASLTALAADLDTTAPDTLFKNLVYCIVSSPEYTIQQ
jgi:uncharacterized protein (DUF1800 family)